MKSNNYILYMMMVILQMASVDSYAQLAYSVVGTYKGKSAQGMSIWEDRAFLFNDGGLCRSFDLKKGQVISNFYIGSASKNNHANSASFGREYVKGNVYPVIYISECRSPYRCFVENITDSASQLVQTLIVKRDGPDSIVHDWVVDSQNKLIYSIRVGIIVDEKTGLRRYCITSYRLPELSEGNNIVLTDKDVKDMFYVQFPNLLQGASIYKNRLYLPVGLQKGMEKRLDSKRAIIIINLKKHKIEKVVDLTDITDKEPEDLDFYQGKALLYTGQKGGMYKVDIK